MPLILVPDVVVEIEPPIPPIIQVAPPLLPSVVIQPPDTPGVTVSPPIDPSVTLVPVVGPPGPRGPMGPSGGGVTFEFIQLIPQSVWVINHQFGRYPIAWSLYDTDGRLCDEYIVEHMDVNICRVSMDVATAGVIRLI